MDLLDTTCLLNIAWTIAELHDGQLVGDLK